jgi:cytochrome c oxidase subunit IV
MAATDLNQHSTVQNPTMKFYAAVWFVLLCIVGLEVFVTYRNLSAHGLLAVLLVLAIIEAGIGLLYFMHLKYDRPILMWSFVISIVFVLLMMNQMWPDAYRMLNISHH